MTDIIASVKTSGNPRLIPKQIVYVTKNKLIAKVLAGYVSAN